MNYDQLTYLKEQNLSLKLLRAETFPLIASFLYRQFKKNNRVIIAASELVTNLNDYLFSLREEKSENNFPSLAAEYLERWANEGFLRKYYSGESDEPVFELTPATEKALDWIRDLDKKEFIGTESRLLKIFEILKEIVYKSSDDPQKRLEGLVRQKEEIEKEIAKINAGEISRFNETQIKERFYDVTDTARKLLSDFRQVEYNFRELDRSVRERQIDSNLRKGKLLEDIFKVQDLLWDTDQGKSFRAFWEFLMSQEKQNELDLLLDSIANLPEIQVIQKDEYIDRLKVNLIEAGDKVNRTNHLLIEQLRKYLDDKVIFESKRIIEIINGIKAMALKVKDEPPKEKDFFILEDKPFIELIMERPLWSPPKNPEFKAIDFISGEADLVMDSLYKQIYINPEELKKRIRVLLGDNSQVTLRFITTHYPVERGIGEVITYLGLASKNPRASVNEAVTEAIAVYNKETGRRFTVDMPQVIFCR